MSHEELQDQSFAVLPSEELTPAEVEIKLRLRSNTEPWSPVMAYHPVTEWTALGHPGRTVHTLDQNPILEL
jgi:hypothetical protein